MSKRVRIGKREAVSFGVGRLCLFTLILLCCSSHSLFAGEIPKYIEEGIGYCEESNLLNTASYEALLHLRAAFSRWNERSDAINEVREELKAALKAKPNLELEERKINNKRIVSFFHEVKEGLLNSVNSMSIPLDLFVAQDVSRTVGNCPIVSDIKENLRRQMRQAKDRKDIALFFPFAECPPELFYPSRTRDISSKKCPGAGSELRRFDILLSKLRETICREDPKGRRRAIIIISNGIQCESTGDKRYMHGRVPLDVERQIDKFQNLAVNDYCVERIPIFLLVVSPNGVPNGIASHWRGPLQKTGGDAFAIDAGNVSNALSSIFKRIGRERICSERKWDAEDVKTGVIAEKVALSAVLPYKVTSSMADPTRFEIKGNLYRLEGDKKETLERNIFPCFRRGNEVSIYCEMPQLPSSKFYQTEMLNVQILCDGLEQDSGYRIRLALYDAANVKVHDLDPIDYPLKDYTIDIHPKNFRSPVTVVTNRRKYLTFDVSFVEPQEPNPLAKATIKGYLNTLLQRRSIFPGDRDDDSIPLPSDWYDIGLDPKSDRDDTNRVGMWIEATREQDTRDVKLEFYPPPNFAVHVHADGEKSNVFRFDVFARAKWKYLICWIFTDENILGVPLLLIPIATLICAILICVFRGHPKLRISVGSVNTDYTDYRRGKSFIHLDKNGNLTYVQQAPPPDVDSYLELDHSVSKITIKCHGSETVVHELGRSQNNKQPLKFWKIGFLILTRRRCEADVGSGSFDIIFKTDEKYQRKCGWIPIIADFYRDGISFATVLLSLLILINLLLMLWFPTVPIGRLMLFVSALLVGACELVLIVLYVIYRVRYRVEYREYRVRSSSSVKLGIFLDLVPVFVSIFAQLFVEILGRLF